MAHTKQSIADIVFQKITGEAQSYDLTNKTLNPVKVFNAQYDLLVETAMQKNNWRWTHIMPAIDVDKLEEAESGQWQYKMRVPEHLLTLEGIYSEDSGRYPLEYDMHDGYIFINFPTKTEPAGFIKYISSPCEEIMPSYFVNWLVLFLAANMVLEVSGDYDKLKILDVMEQRALRIALAADIKNRGAQAIPTDAFVAARW